MRLILCDDSQLGLLRSVLPDAHEAPETHGTCVLPFSRWAAVSLSAGAADAETSVVWPCGLKVDGFEVSSVLWLAGLSDQGADPQQQLLRQKWLAAVSLVFPESAGVPRACDPLYAGDEAFRMQVLAQRLGWDAVNVLHAATRHAGGMTVGLAANGKHDIDAFCSAIWRGLSWSIGTGTDLLRFGASGPD